MVRGLGLFPQVGHGYIYVCIGEVFVVQVGLERQASCVPPPPPPPFSVQQRQFVICINNHKQT